MDLETVSYEFVNAMNYKHTDMIYSVEPGRKYNRIVEENKKWGGRSVHAFVERATGKLIKSATWKTPQKTSTGELAYRFDISTKEGLDAAVEASDRHGGYLYQR